MDLYTQLRYIIEFGELRYLSLDGSMGKYKLETKDLDNFVTEIFSEHILCGTTILTHIMRET